jgi:ABC-type lipoprotein release transport system permease subunit
LAPSQFDISFEADASASAHRDIASSGSRFGTGPASLVLGAFAGVPLAWLLASRLRDLLYAVPPFDPLTIGAVLGALLLVLAASIVPARRATLIDPARTMRTE